MKYLLFYFICITSFLQAQDNCIGKGADQLFQGNRIGASFSPQGSKFLPGYDYFKVPYTSENSPYTLFASSPWIGGYNNGELKISAQRYAEETHLDFYIGPLLEDAVPLDTECYRYNKIWSSNRNDILRHIADFALDGEISDTITSVFGWPAEGNNYFSAINGFELPIGHRGGWADFSDNNNNEVYEPHLGEHPCIYVNDSKHIPEEIMWMVFNDQGPHTASGGLPLGVEIQLTVFAFNCQDNTVLNNALFNNYKIINQNSVPLDSVQFGMWSDYDLGCSEDDFAGCDSTRNTEYAYNQDIRDGDINGYCITEITPGYGDFPPIQSLTYLSHRMTSFIVNPLGHFNPYPYPYPQPYQPAQYYNLLNGEWRDGSPITEFENGYNPGSSYPITKYLYPGDPRDLSQWSQNSFSPSYGDPSTLSSAYIGELLPYVPVTIETVYLFHQDSSLDHIGQIGFMQYQIDSLLQLLKDTTLPCTAFQYCEGEDCVWPGDFDHNGIADHYDLLYWGVMKDQWGPPRDGKINWDGHLADSWSLTLPNLLNAKHGDGNGNSVINEEDLDRNIQHYLLINPYYEPQALFPEGPEILLTSGPMEPSGRIRNLRVRTGITLENVLGLAYEIDFDTSIYKLQNFRAPLCPADSNIICLYSDTYFPIDPNFEISSRYSFVKTDHQPMELEEGTILDILFGGLNLKEGIDVSAIPDTVIIRLKNLIAIDPFGNDLYIGSNVLRIPRDEIVGIHDPTPTATLVYPNPAEETLQIHTELETEAQIFTIQGQFIRQLTSAEIKKPVDISSLLPGIYVVRILGSGESIKVVIQ